MIEVILLLRHLLLMWPELSFHIPQENAVCFYPKCVGFLFCFSMKTFLFPAMILIIRSGVGDTPAMLKLRLPLLSSATQSCWPSKGTSASASEILFNVAIVFWFIFSPKILFLGNRHFYAFGRHEKTPVTQRCSGILPSSGFWNS